MTQHTVESDARNAGILTHCHMVGVDVRVGDVTSAVEFYERFLGSPALRRSPRGASFDVGPSTLWLKPRREAAPTMRDRTVALTFLVSNVDTAAARLRAAGISVGEPLRYEVGATADLYDPDGHWISLYEASPAAMSWPSGSKLKALATQIDEVPRLVYLFMFVPDAEEAFEFYHGTLGLSYLECRPCRRGSTDHERGVVKYDAGGVMLTTHLVEGDRDSATAVAVRDRRLLAEITPVFATRDGARTRAAIRETLGRHLSGGAEGEAELSFFDPFGRPFAIVPDTAPDALPSGRRIDLALERIR